MCLERTTEGWVGVDGTGGGGETVPYVGAGHWEGTPSELRPASFDGNGPSSGGAKLAYIRVGRSKHDKVREVRWASTVESLMHDSSMIAAPFNRPYDFLLVRYCKYSSLLYRFWVIWRWIISWPWNLGYRSLNIIQTCTIWKLGCSFLLAFHSNYGSVLHNFWDKARYWWKVWFFSSPMHSTPPLGGLCRNIAIPFGMEKLEWWGYPMVKKLWGYV